MEALWQVLSFVMMVVVVGAVVALYVRLKSGSRSLLEHEERRDRLKDEQRKDR